MTHTAKNVKAYMKSAQIDSFESFHEFFCLQIKTLLMIRLRDETEGIYSTLELFQ
jgi:hypothetical protein